MFKNYLKIALRNLISHKVFSFINIVGLAIGIAASIMILRYIYYETTYESFNQNADHVYRVQVDRYQNDALQTKSARSYAGLTGIFQEEIPEIVSTTRLYPEDCLYRYGDKKISGQAVYWVDNAFIELFDLELVKTASNEPLRDTYSAVLTESVVNRLFGDEDPIGKTIIHNEGLPFIVTGVVKDYPASSHLHFDLLLSINTIGAVVGEGWMNTTAFPAVYTYILIEPDASPVAIENKFSQIVDTHFGYLSERNSRIELFLQPVTDIHLKSDLSNEHSTNSNMSIIYALSLIALIILIMAWINFINLSTARALERAKEVGIRKVAGTSKFQIIKQFVFESILLNIIAFIIALVLVNILGPITDKLTSQNISLSFSSFPQFWLIIFVVYLLCSVIAGLYPAVLLSSFNPITILTGKFRNTGTGRLITKILVVFQFAAAIALMIGTLVISRQIAFVQGQDLGFSSDQVLVVNTPRTLIATGLTEDRDRRIRYYERFKERLLEYPFIKYVSVSSILPGRPIPGQIRGVTRLASDPQNISLSGGSIEFDFFKGLDMDFIAGRSFSREILSDTAQTTPGVVLNETAALMLGFDSSQDAVNQFLYSGGGENPRFKVLGVVNDHHQEYLRKAIVPMIYFYGHNYEFGYMLIKLNVENLSNHLEVIGDIWEQIYPDDPFDYFFLDEFFNRQYTADRQLGHTTTLFATLAIIIATLGLYGLASLSIIQRTKEIGIRKVLGAPLSNLLYQLTRNFLFLVMIANIIAWPVVYFIMDKWLNGFVVRINWNILLFILPGLFVIIVAVIAISYNTIKVAQSNPVKSLRYE